MSVLDPTPIDVVIQVLLKALVAAGQWPWWFTLAVMGSALWLVSLPATRRRRTRSRVNGRHRPRTN